jgi:hypothetical protein
MDPLVTALNDKTLRVVAYLLAGALALAAAVRSGRGSHRGEGLVTAFWASAGLALIVLAISRQIDLASHIAGVGRSVFRTEGWYGDRRPLQKLVIVLVLAGSLAVGVVGSGLLLLRDRGQLLFGFVAMTALATFLVVRAISWHDIDAVLYRRSIEQVQINALAELVITGAAALAATAAVLHPGRGGPPSGT